MRFLDSFAMQRTEKEVLTEPSWQYTVDHFILVYVKLEEPIGHLGDHMQKEAGDTQQGKVKINGYKETRGLALCVCYGGKGIIISLGYSTSSNGEESPTVSIRWGDSSLSQVLIAQYPVLLPVVTLHPLHPSSVPDSSFPMHSPLHPMTRSHFPAPEKPHVPHVLELFPATDRERCFAHKRCS